MYHFFDPDTTYATTEDYGYRYYFSYPFTKLKETGFDTRTYAGQENYQDYTQEDLNDIFEYYAYQFNKFHGLDFPLETLINAIRLDEVHTMHSAEVYTPDGDYIETILVLDYKDLKEKMWDTFTAVPTYTKTEDHDECMIFGFTTPCFKDYRVEIACLKDKPW